MLYHASNISGLKTLQPHTSTHKKPYVYAIENLTACLLFGAKHDDFDFMISSDENEHPIVYECYPDSFKKVFEEKSCSVYEVSGDGFKRGMTSWDAELVNENEVSVINEIIVTDLYDNYVKKKFPVASLYTDINSQMNIERK